MPSLTVPRSNLIHWKENNNYNQHAYTLKCQVVYDWSAQDASLILRNTNLTRNLLSSNLQQPSRLCVFLYNCRNHTYVRSPAAPSATQIPVLSGSTWRQSTAQRPTSPKNNAATCRPGRRRPERMERTRQVHETESSERTKYQTTVPREVWTTTCTSNPSKLKTLW